MVWLNSCFITFTMAVLFIATLGGIYAYGAKRVFLGRFAIGAWGYLMVYYGPYNLNYLGDRMLTTRALRVFDGTFLQPDAGYVIDIFPPVYSNPTDEGRSQYNAAGGCVFSLSSGLLCGAVALRFAHRNSRRLPPFGRNSHAPSKEDLSIGEEAEVIQHSIARGISPGNRP